MTKENPGQPPLRYDANSPDRFLVIDGATNADAYGTAVTPRGAINVAGRFYVDGVRAVYLYRGPVKFRDGLPRKGPFWMALSGAYEGPVPAHAVTVKKRYSLY